MGVEVIQGLRLAVVEDLEEKLLVEGRCVPSTSFDQKRVTHVAQKPQIPGRMFDQGVLERLLHQVRATGLVEGVVQKIAQCVDTQGRHLQTSGDATPQRQKFRGSEAVQQTCIAAQHRHQHTVLVEVLGVQQFQLVEALRLDLLGFIDQKDRSKQRLFDVLTPAVAQGLKAAIAVGDR